MLDENLAPVFQLSSHEFKKNPINVLENLLLKVQQYGICKIIPPKDDAFISLFQSTPSKYSNVRNMATFDRNAKFKTRIQNLKEMNGKQRARLNFVDSLIKFHAQYGSQSLQTQPRINSFPIDLFHLRNLVQEKGDSEIVSQRGAWPDIAQDLGISSWSNQSVCLQLKIIYEKWILPFEMFLFKQKNPFPKTSCVKSRDLKDLTVRNSFGQRVSSSPKTAYLLRDTPNHRKQQDISSCRPALSDRTNLKQNQPDSNYSLRKRKNPSEDLVEPNEHDSGMYAPPQNRLNNSRKIQLLRHNSPVIYIKPKDFVSGKYCEECHLPCDGPEIDCSSCNAIFHRSCLCKYPRFDALEEWYCHECLALKDDFSFYEGEEFSLNEFKMFADGFLRARFPSGIISDEQVEDEFWNILSSDDPDSHDSELEVHYGADISSSAFSSGFPTKSKFPHDIRATHPWNLNNIPQSEGSLLRYLDHGISGMMVPWVYIGMCFSAFCWHVEDHNAYSVNYLHTGATKTWYGVPACDSKKFEAVMRKQMPDIFESQPGLLFHITTLLSPKILKDNGVSVYKVHQHQGEFVITMPQAYHAGFNQGFNVAEAVNFALGDWLTYGCNSVKLYQKYLRSPVFSHDELMLRLLEEVFSQYLRSQYCAINHAGKNNTAVKTWWYSLQYHINEMITQELKQRKKFLRSHKNIIMKKWNENSLGEQVFNCSVCKCFCYLSAVYCSCCCKNFCLRDSNRVSVYYYIFL